MAADKFNGQQIGLNQGKGVVSSDKFGMFMTYATNEVIAAFARSTVTMDKHMVRNIAYGKSATFPVMGRASARYLPTGTTLTEGRKEIKQTERVITIDGTLTSDVMIYDIEEAMNNFDVRGEYTRQLGESLALSADGAVLAELAKAVNLHSGGSNENIEGLGKPILIKAYHTTASTGADTQAKRGKKILEALTEARAKLTSNYVPSNDRFFFTTPENYSAILAALSPTEANYAALIDPETGNIRNVMGFTVIETPHLTLGDGVASGHKHQFPQGGTGSLASQNTVTAGNVVGLFMHRSAIGTVKLKDLTMEHGRDIDKQADIIVAKYAYGHGYLRPEATGALVFGTSA